MDAKQRWSSRKFWAMVFFQLVNTLLVWYAKIPTDAYLSVTWLLLGGYFLANLSQSWIERAAPK